MNRSQRLLNCSNSISHMDPVRWIMEMYAITTQKHLKQQKTKKSLSNCDSISVYCSLFELIRAVSSVVFEIDAAFT